MKLDPIEAFLWVFIASAILWILLLTPAVVYLWQQVL